MCNHLLLLLLSVYLMTQEAVTGQWHLVSELMVIKQLQATVVVMWRCINKIELN